MPRKNRYKKPLKPKSISQLDPAQFARYIAEMAEGLPYPSPADDRPPLYLEDTDTGEVQRLQVTDNPFSRLLGGLLRNHPDMSNEEHMAVFVRFMALQHVMTDPRMSEFLGEKVERGGMEGYTIDDKVIQALALLPIEIRDDENQWPTADQVLEFISKL